MRYSLTALARQRTNPRRSAIPIRPIVPPATFATNLYRAVYAPVVVALDQIAARTVAEYERTLSTLVTDSAADIQAAANDGASFLERLVLNLLPALSDWVIRTERWHRGKWRGAVLTATGVDLETTLMIAGQPQSVEQVIAWNTALVKDVAAQGQARIGNAVFAGLRDRLPARDVAKTIREAVDMSRARSVRIASDQLSKLTSALDAERQVEAGLDRFKWRHSGKRHPRANHLARDGKIYLAKTLREVDGDGVIAADDVPGSKPFCGCRRQAILSLD